MAVTIHPGTVYGPQRAIQLAVAFVFPPATWERGLILNYSEKINARITEPKLRAGKVITLT
jgi:hypothetical protein